jgi:hypothetical protein
MKCGATPSEACVSHRDSKQASSANRQAEVVAANILALADGGELATYEPMGPTMIVPIVPIGPYGGAGQLPGRDELMSADAVSQAKGRALRTDYYAARFGTELPPVDAAD